MWRSLLFLLMMLSTLFPLQAQGQLPHPQNKAQLIIFSGSDWCLPCIKLDRQVISTTEFKDYAASNLEIIIADFPQTKSQETSLQSRNDSLAELYNPQGQFPRLVLLPSPKAKPVFLKTSHTNPQSLVHEIANQLPKKRIFRRQQILMGTAFEFALVHHNDSAAQALLDQCVAETIRLEAILSEWQDSSEVSEVNRQSGRAWVDVSDELFDLTGRCVELSRITQGAFDISFRGMDLWEFDGKELATWPDSQLIRYQLSTMGYQDIEFAEHKRIKLAREGMAIGFGAVGKGFAADVIKEMMIDEGVEAGVINASGDLTTWGTRPDGRDWIIGITNPNIPEGLKFGLKLSDRSIATSGSYEKYFTFQAKRFAHIINPKTGIPVWDKKSVSVISNSAELSDALATAFFVMDTEVALDLANQLPGVSCIIINHQDEVFSTPDIEME